VQKKIIQQDISPQPLLKDSEIRAGYKYTDLSEVQVVNTFFGRAKVRKINPSKQKESRWLWGVGVMLVIAGWLLLEWVARPQSSTSAPVVEPVMEIELVPTPALPANEEPTSASPPAQPIVPKQVNQSSNVPAKAAETKPARSNVVKPAAPRPSQNLSGLPNISAPQATGGELQNKPSNILTVPPVTPAPASVAPPVVVSPTVGEPQSAPLSP